jgi:hypothetical protein
MTRSIFHGLALRRDGESVTIDYPQRLHSKSLAANCAWRHGMAFQAGEGETWSVRTVSGDGCPTQLKSFFADLNGFRAPYQAVDPAPAADPLVSCIVVVNENRPFVREQLLPALWANSAGTPIEVILVHNGSAPGAPIEGVSEIASAWGAVSAGYNTGARAARGDYLAILHDDCIVDDPQWLPRALEALTGGVDAVAAEYRHLDAIGGIAISPLPVAKAVPLVLRRATFEAVGGFDEFHYVGYEDLDFTISLLQAGKKLSACGLTMRHFSGMSSVLKYCALPGLDELFAMTALPASAIRERFREFVARGVNLEGVDLLRLALDVQLLYVLKKYRAWLRSTHGEAYEHCRTALERSIATRCPFDATLILPRFKVLDRGIAGEAAT